MQCRDGIGARCGCLPGTRPNGGQTTQTAHPAPIARPGAMRTHAANHSADSSSIVQPFLSASAIKGGPSRPPARKGSTDKPDGPRHPYAPALLTWHYGAGVTPVPLLSKAACSVQSKPVPELKFHPTRGFHKTINEARNYIICETAPVIAGTLKQPSSNSVPIRPIFHKKTVLRQDACAAADVPCPLFVQVTPNFYT